MHIIENGNVAAALGVLLCRANVIAAYPITPQTPLTEKLSEYVESGKMKLNTFPSKANIRLLPCALPPHQPEEDPLPPPAPTGCSTCMSRFSGRQAQGFPL